MEFLITTGFLFLATIAVFCYARDFDSYNEEVERVRDTNSTNIYINKLNDVEFIEITRYDMESVMLRTDVNVRMLIPHKELDKHYVKKV